MPFGWHVASSRPVIDVPLKCLFDWDATTWHRSRAPYALLESLTTFSVRNRAVPLCFVATYAKGLAMGARQVNFTSRAKSSALGSCCVHM